MCVCLTLYKNYIKQNQDNYNYNKEIHQLERADGCDGNRGGYKQL